MTCGVGAETLGRSVHGHRFARLQLKVSEKRTLKSPVPYEQVPRMQVLLIDPSTMLGFLPYYVI